MRTAGVYVLLMGGAVGLVACGGSDGGPRDGGFGDASGPFHLVSLTTDGDGVIVSEDGYIDCGGTCEAEFPEGYELVLRPEADTGAMLSSWGGACAGAPSEACTLVVDGPKEITATFGPARYEVQVTRAGAGWGRVYADQGELDCGLDCREEYPFNTEVVLTAETVDRTTLTWGGACEGASGDTCTVRVDGTVEVTATFVPDAPTFSASDRNPSVVLSDDQLGVELFSMHFGGVRSTHAVEPGSGVYYVEGTRYGEPGADVFALLTRDSSLNGTPWTESRQAFGLSTRANGFYGDDVMNSLVYRYDTTTYGFVVDYRGASPVVYVLGSNLGENPSISDPIDLDGITEPLYFGYFGPRRHVGIQATANFGGDHVNFPFTYDAEAVLRAAGYEDVANALMLGFGYSYAGTFQEPPTLSMPDDRTVSLGASVTLTATAEDEEDGSLDEFIRWEDTAMVYGQRDSARGTTFTFTPADIGIHDITATVRDRGGKVTQRTTRVVVEGALENPDTVRLTPSDSSGRGIELDPDGLGVFFTEEGKRGIRANQGLYGAFWYFEARPANAEMDAGIGLTIRGGSLDPYWDQFVPPSASVNALGSTWRNLIHRSTLPDELRNRPIGFAVDYRGETPTVYVIIGGAVRDTIEMTDATVPVYPFVYGNPTSNQTPPDIRVNFGASQFAYDPMTALMASDIDPSGLVLGWGQ